MERGGKKGGELRRDKRIVMSRVVHPLFIMDNYIFFIYLFIYFFLFSFLFFDIFNFIFQTSSSSLRPIRHFRHFHLIHLPFFPLLRIPSPPFPSITPFFFFYFSSLSVNNHSHSPESLAVDLPVDDASSISLLADCRWIKRHELFHARCTSSDWLVPGLLFKA